MDIGQTVTLMKKKYKVIGYIFWDKKVRYVWLEGIDGIIKADKIT